MTSPGRNGSGRPASSAKISEQRRRYAWGPSRSRMNSIQPVRIWARPSVEGNFDARVSTREVESPAMTVDDIRKVCVVGAGTMGPQIPQRGALAGYPVILV